MLSQPMTLFTSSVQDGSQGWEAASPYPDLMPPPSLVAGTGRNAAGHGGGALGLFGEYKTCVFGSWRKTVKIQPNQHYRLTAYARSQKIVDTRRSLFCSLTWNDAQGNAVRSPDYAYIPPADGTGGGGGDWAKIDYTSQSPANAATLTINLGLRWAPIGHAWFDDIQLTAVTAPQIRMVRAASAFYNMTRGETKDSAESVARFVKLIDEKLPKGTDILCLPEGITAVGTGRTFLENSEAVPGGPTSKVLSDLAKRHRCYVCAGLYERRVGKSVYNTAALFDRDGKFAGSYQKTHLPREEAEAGITPGDTYPVFDTDFGKIGIMICWDVHFPEPARSLALQGAQLILLPIWGGNETLTRARAIENHVYLISASYHMKNMILDPLGNSLAEAPGQSVGLITADIPLNQQIIQPWLSDMKNRTWIERRGDIAWRIAEPARSRDVTPTAQEKPVPYTLTEGHPRAYINAAELPELRQRAKTTNKAEYDSLLAYYNDNVNKLDGGGDINDLGVGGDYVDFITKFALLYLLTDDKAHAAACIRAVEKLLLIDVEGTYVATQRRVRALGLAYDWCHDQMSANFRRRIAKQIEAYVQAAIDSGEATLEGGHLAGHVANMVPHFLAAGIAIGDEGNGSWLINQCLRWTEKFLENSKYFLEGNSYQQSYPYTCAYVAEIAAIFRLMEAGLGQTPHKDHPWFQNTVNWWLYPLRTDQTYIRYGDYFCAWPLFENGSYYRPLAYIANRYKDPHARWFAEQFKLSGKDEFHLLLYPAAGPNSPPAKAPSDLPRTSFHEKMGIAIARGDWSAGSNSDPTTGGTVAAFKCSPHYLHNHCHRDANSITLYHKGDLAIDSGIYDGYETPQWYNYYIRTIAHNSIVVYDPEERFVSRNRPQANDGGQRFINQPHWSPGDYTQFLQGQYKDGTILAQWQKSDHSYVCGDASNCYNPAKLKKFLRHVTFILDYPHKSAVSMLILDEIELNKDALTPKFLLHAISEPQANGNTVTITQGQGKLTANFLSPVSLEKIGGPGKEWWVDGNNYAPLHAMKGPHTPGAWRIEATAKSTAGRTFQILTLLTPTDLSAPVPESPKLEQTANAWIVKQGSLTVALYKNVAPTNLSGQRQLLIKLAR